MTGATTVQLEVWQLITLLLAFLGCVAAFGKILLGQFSRMLDLRFEAQEQLRKQGAEMQSQKFAELERLERENARELFNLKADLPNRFVMREDWIRFSGTLDSKLDGINNRITKLITRERDSDE